MNESFLYSVRGVLPYWAWWIPLMTVTVVSGVIVYYRRRPDWKRLAAAYPAIDPPQGRPLREFLAVGVLTRVRAVGGPRRYHDCFVGLEPAGIRIAAGPHVKTPEPDAVVPWDVITGVSDGYLTNERMLPAKRFRLATRSDEILIGEPAGTEAAMQWERVKSYGPAVAIVGAPAPSDTVVAHAPGSAAHVTPQASGLKWRPRDLLHGTRRRVALTALATGCLFFLGAMLLSPAAAEVDELRWSWALLILCVTVSAVYAPRTWR